MSAPRLHAAHHTSDTPMGTHVEQRDLVRRVLVVLRHARVVVQLRAHHDHLVQQRHVAEVGGAWGREGTGEGPRGEGGREQAGTEVRGGRSEARAVGRPPDAAWIAIRFIEILY